MSDQHEKMTSTEKKSEAIEIRVPYDTKQRFMEACQSDDRTASEVLRNAIDAYLVHGGFARSGRRLTAFALAASVAVVAVAGYVAYRTQEQNAALQQQNSSLQEQNRQLASMRMSAFKVNDAFDRAWQEQAAGSNEGNPLAQMFFSKADENGDDRLTREEFIKGITDRGTISTNDDIPSTNIILRTVRASLVLPEADADALKKLGKLDSCFATLGQIGDAEWAREFYALDSDRDNQLTRAEFSRSDRIPSVYQLTHDFAVKDTNADGYLSEAEAQEDAHAWMQQNSTENNATTQSKTGDVPEACRNPAVQEPAGRLLIKVEKLKRFIYMPMHGEKNGVPHAMFQKLDLNADSRLDFREFVAWYNMSVRDWMPAH